MRALRILTFALLAIALLAGCSKRIDSQWRGERHIEIDGADTEWEGARVYIEGARAGIGLLNDAQDLYLCLVLTDPGTQLQVMRQGFTVWFDPKGKKNKTFGIRFPLGMQEGERPWGPGMRERGGRGVAVDPERIQALFERLSQGLEMDILGPRQLYEKRRVLFSDSEDIQLKVAYTYGRLAYELKVPLARVASGGDFKAGNTIGLGFETPKVDREAMRQRMGLMGDGMRGGGMRGMGGGGRRGGMGGGIPEPFQLWTKVRLASR